MGTGGGHVRITVLGRFEVVVDGTAVPDERWTSRRASELVQLLALAENHRLLRDQVIDAPWPHLDSAACAANLRKSAHLARQAVGDARVVELKRGEVVLFPGRDVVVDAVEFDRAARAAIAEEEPSGCAAAAQHYTGLLLPGAVYEDWASGPRARLAGLHLDCLRAARAVGCGRGSRPARRARAPRAHATGRRRRSRGGSIQAGRERSLHG